MSCCKNKVIVKRDCERIVIYDRRLVYGGEGAGTGITTPIEITGTGLIMFDNMAALKENGTKGLDVKSEFKLLGYYQPYDGGGANYVCKYLWSQSAYPWAVDLGATNEIEYELLYNPDGTPQIDKTTGEYVLNKDINGNPIPVYENGAVKYKHLYAVINETTVNYKMFGAKLDGLTDDYNAIYLTHLYQSKNYTIEPLTNRKRYYIKVENHDGIIRKDNDEPIMCCGDIDLSGSQLLIQDCNATWYGFYLWGDNDEDYFTFEPTADTAATYVKDNFVIGTAGNESTLDANSLLNLKEDPYAVRDDGGYLYSEPRYELLLHTLDGILTSPVLEDWNNPGGLEINSPISDYVTHEVTTQTVNSHFTSSYTKLPATHYYFKGCDVKLETSANSYCSVLWCKCHNAHVSGFNFMPDTTKMHNTVFKNTMIYIWGSYNVEVSDIVGFNAAGKREGSTDATSGYVIRATNCLNLKLHDISVQGYWGATAMNCVKDIHIERVNINRLDIHNYFYNLYIDHCNLFNHSIQIGEGRGIVQVTNCNFYVNELAADSYPNAHMIEFNLTYGRIFEGRILIQNCNVFLKGADGNEFDVCKIDFSPEAVSTLDHYKFPEVVIKDCYFHSYDPNTYLVYFMIAGTRNCKTSTKAPTVLTGYSRDGGNDDTGTLVWKYLGRGVDWIDNGDTERLTVVPGQFVRTYEKFVDSEGKTSFYNFKYYQVVTGGTLPTPTETNAPTDTTGSNFTLGTATVKYVDRSRWEASRNYAVGEYCFTENSSWLPVYCYECTTAGKSNGWRPTHTSGKVIEGEDVYPKNLDACWWQYVSPASTFITKNFTPNMTVSEGDILYADHRLYKVKSAGTLNEPPPLNTPWLQEFNEGTAVLEFIGKDWAAVTWWAQGAYCLSYDNSNVLQVYQLVDQDGTTSGSIPVPGNGRCVDGDIIWQNTTSAATKQWAAQTQFYKGDIVSANGSNYECVFDGRLELPHQTVIENISTNMTVGGDVFAFWDGGTDIPTKYGDKGKWTIKINNVELYRFINPTNGYFCHAGNPAPTIIEGNATSSGGSSVGSGEIMDGSISENKLDSAVRAKLLGSKNVTNANIADGTITADKLAFTVGEGGAITNITWNNITGKPSTFPPSAHTHVKADITDLDDTGGGTVTPEPEPGGDSGDTFFSETVTNAGASAWIDSNQYTIPANMTKMKITATAPSGGIEIGCITDDDPWTEVEAIASIDALSNTETSVIVSVPANSKIRPIFNYWGGTADGTLTIKLEGSDSINTQSAAGTIQAYAGS